MLSKQENLEFSALFGKKGEYGSFNDFKDPRQVSSENINAPPEEEQLKNEVGEGGITLFSRRRRFRINDLGIIHESGCSSVDGFFESESNRRNYDDLH